MSAIRADNTAAAPIPPRALARIRARIATHAGMVLPDWVLSSRIRDRMLSLGIESADEYASLIVPAYGVDELDHLLERVRVGETSFFRHTGHVRTLVTTVLPAWRARHKRGEIRAWSAGCASGEEAYTLAMLLSTECPRPDYRVSVLATDVSRRAIDVARRGEYAASALSSVPARLRQASFVAMKGGVASAASTQMTRYRVARRVAQLVTFERMNLLDSRYPTDMDVIWCRNVFIYFSKQARSVVARRLAQSLRPGGVLFVGYSEHLRDIDAFEPVRTAHGVIYKRTHHQPTATAQLSPTRVRQPPVPTRSARADDDSRPSGRRQTDTRSTSQPSIVHVSVRLTGRYDGCGRLAAELSDAMAGEPTDVTVYLDNAQMLDDRVAPILRRAQSAARATNVRFFLNAHRPGTVRWLRRHGLQSDDCQREGDDA